MNSELDQVLRDAFERIGEAPPPTGIAPAVVRKVRRQTRVRIAVTAGAVVALAVAAVPLGLHSTGRQAAQPGTSRADRSLVVSAYSGLPVTDPSAKPKSLLLDKATGGYVDLPYLSALPSPDGTRALVRTGDDTPTSPLRSGILDPATGSTVRWIPGYTGEGSWSPDGREILFTVRPRLGDNGFAIVNATTLKSTFAKVDLNADNSTGLDFVWAPDGNEVALTVSHAAGQENQSDRVTGIRFYNRAGNVTHTLPATAELHSSTDFSPDGRRIALHNYLPDAPTRIISAATGAVQKTLRLAGRNELIGWADDDHLIVRHWADATTSSELRIVDLAGRVTTVVHLRPDAVAANTVSVGSSDGLTPNATGLPF